MPTNRSPSAKAMRGPDTVVRLVNGDAVNEDNLMVEAAPGATPKLTLGYLHDLIAGIVSQVGIGNTRVSNGSPAWIGSQWGGQSLGVWANSTNSASAFIWFPLTEKALPNGSTLVSVETQITGSPTDVALPATMPKMSLWKVTKAGVATQLGSTTTDGSALLATYQAQHALTVATSAVIDRSLYTYWMQVAPEAGANSNGGLFVTSPAVTWTGSGTGSY